MVYIFCKLKKPYFYDKSYLDVNLSKAKYIFEVMIYALVCYIIIDSDCRLQCLKIETGNTHRYIVDYSIKCKTQTKLVIIMSYNELKLEVLSTTTNYTLSERAWCTKCIINALQEKILLHSNIM